jgi:hypothetical protein
MAECSSQLSNDMLFTSLDNLADCMSTRTSVETTSGILGLVIGSLKLLGLVTR